ncbi:hypothetical protein ND748_03600 [Frankia sp. AiPs1]|uniref:hypothetical protein n=1 Tax=Frankia sp. AiPs1 TaxID=573493 RepID=UPI0020446558|nr:hypothetical protein [Frankia sp. AiPs1]MCM3920762.1 hypothetical protein [Frankia sp. AiPs1]
MSGVSWVAAQDDRYRSLVDMEVPDRNGLLVAAPLSYDVGRGWAPVEAEFIPVSADRLVEVAMGLVAMTDVGIVAMHPQDTPADATRLAFTVGLRLGVFARPFGVVLAGRQPVGPETSTHGRRVVAHDVEVLVDAEQGVGVPEAEPWVRRQVWEIMPAGRYAAWQSAGRTG